MDLAAVLALFSSMTWGQEKEKERLKECADVIGETLNVPDGIPQDLMDKAECVIVFPSVKKIAIGIGGSYGRGANKNLYGKELSAEQIIVKRAVKTPAAAQPLVSLLNKKSPKNRSGK